MKRVSCFAAFALCLLQSPVMAESVECEPGRTAFTLANTGSEFVWKGIRLSIRRSFNVTLLEGIHYALAAPGSGLQENGLRAAPLPAAFADGSPASRGEAILLASNVGSFRKALPAGFGTLDVADLSYCSAHQINLRCSDASDSGHAAALNCSLAILDPAGVITP